MMQIWKTTSFIAWRDSELNRSSKALQSRVSATRKSSQKVSNASTLYTHNSKGHEKVSSSESLHQASPESGGHPSFDEAFLFWLKLRFISFAGPTGRPRSVAK